MTDISEETIPWTHEFIENRFNISTDITEQAPEGGSWQILPGSELIIRHEPITELRHLAFPIPLESDLDSDEFSWQSNGIESRSVENLRPDDNRNYLLVTTNSHNNLELFTDLVLFLLVSQVTNPSAILQRLRILQSWWGSPMPPLSDEAAAGLFGELFYLSRQLTDDWADKVHSWDGPNSALNDFNWAEQLGLHVEVKTTRGFEEPLEHTVSSIHQLTVQENHNLVLFSMSARPDPGGEESLDELIQEIILEIEDNPELHEEFVIKLAESGWAPNTNEHRYIVDDELIRYYHVENGFPRITLANEQNAIEDGTIDQRIRIGSYRIRMENLEDFLLPEGPHSPLEISELCNQE